MIGINRPADVFLVSVYRLWSLELDVVLAAIFSEATQVAFTLGHLHSPFSLLVRRALHYPVPSVAGAISSILQLRFVRDAEFSHDLFRDSRSHAVSAPADA